MNENPFYDLQWWARFIKDDDIMQAEMLTVAMCQMQELPYEAFEDILGFFMDTDRRSSSSAYNREFDKRYLYPLHIKYEISVQQTPGRLELHTVDRHKLFKDKATLITHADLAQDWDKELREVVAEIESSYPHIPAWHEYIRTLDACGCPLWMDFLDTEE